MLTPLPRLERTGSSVGCSPAPRRPSPSGRRVGSNEKLSRPAQGSRAFRPAHLHLGCAEDFPRGFSRTITRARLLQWLPDEPTILRTGLPPVGLRDPGGLSAIWKLSSLQDLPSCRTARRLEEPSRGNPEPLFHRARSHA